MDILRPLLPWLTLLILFYGFTKLYAWARGRKTGAFVFGALTQMLLPDPYAERTLKIVQERKQETRREQDENGDPDASDNRLEAINPDDREANPDDREANSDDSEATRDADAGPGTTPR